MLYVNQLVFILNKPDGSKESETKRQSGIPENQNNEIEEAKRLRRVGGNCTLGDKPLWVYHCK